MKRIMWSTLGIAIGMLAGAASPALAVSDVIGLTINPTGTILPGRTAVTISGTVTCDISSGPGAVTLEMLTLNQTGRKTQFILATDPAVPADPLLICDGSQQMWSRTVQVVFPNPNLPFGSGRVHKGKAGVTVRFADANDVHTAFGSVFIK